MRCGILLIVIALFTPIFYGCGSSNPYGGYHPPQTVVNTIGIKKVPLAAAGITDYKMFFSFEKEPSQKTKNKNTQRSSTMIASGCFYLSHCQ